MRIIFAGLWVLAAWKWGDWKNWQKYYSTILFFIAIAFFAHIISANHRLWVLTDSFIGTGQTINLFLDAFVIFPATILLFLPYYPSKLGVQLSYIFKWGCIYAVLEYIVSLLGLISYENGWSIWWSFFFDLVMFPILAIHHKNPLVAWTLSIAFAAFIWIYFGFREDLLQ